MKTYHWLFVAAMAVAVVAGCGPKGTSHEMGSKTISTDKLDLAVFGKGDAAKYCPVSGDAIEAGKGYVHTLKDGKKIMLCCPLCVKDVDKNEAKFKDFLF